MVWPEVDWFVLGKKLVRVFKNRVGEKYNEFTQIYMDRAKKNRDRDKRVWDGYTRKRNLNK